MKTLIELFEKSVNAFSEEVFLWEKRTDKYEGTTYLQAHEQVLMMGAGLMALGLKKGERAGLIAEGQNAWLISELGILYAGGVNVPLSIKLDAATDLKFRLEHSGAKMVIVSRSQAHKIEEIRDELPGLEKVIYIDGKAQPGEKDVDYAAVLSMGEALLSSKEGAARFEDMWKGISPNDMANISYTSGTSADPKGIMLSHLNYVANVYQGHSLMSIPGRYRTLAILPWDHSFAHTACLYSFMVKGASVGSVQIGQNSMETLKNIPQNIKELKPHVLMSVPALAKNFRKNIEAGIRKKGKKAEKLFNHALKVAYRYNGMGWDRGKGLRFVLKPLLMLYDKILFSKIREGFGGELQFFIGGGALLDVELQKFFYAIGIPMCQGYGLSEASPVISSNALHAIKFGSSGRVVKDLELKIMDEAGNVLPGGEKGEIVVKGDNVMSGYWKNEKATAETLKDGWLHTGDMGHVDKDGFLYVSGRFKSLLIGSDGEKYSPEGIEEALVDKSQYIEQVVLHNNQNPYTVGMVVPNMRAVNKALEQQGVAPGSEEGLKQAVHLIHGEVNEYFKGGKYEGEFPERWLPSNIAILPEAFTEQNRLMNSTMKVVRGKVVEYFDDELEHLYSSEAKMPVNKRNLSNVRRWYQDN